ncbi:hypothetical protein J6590_043438 [Homalodisca vitripennis]|nr:hypothetical protein J6590_043438 [Homalodisca vitripennis]
MCRGKGGKLFQVLGEVHNNDEKCSIFILGRHLVLEGDSRDCNKEPVLSRFRDFTRVSRCRDPRELPKVDEPILREVYREEWSPSRRGIQYNLRDHQKICKSLTRRRQVHARKHTTAGEPDVRYGSVGRYGTADKQAGAGNSNSESAATVGLTDYPQSSSHDQTPGNKNPLKCSSENQSNPPDAAINLSMSISLSTACPTGKQLLTYC